MGVMTSKDGNFSEQAAFDALAQRIVMVVDGRETRPGFLADCLRPVCVANNAFASSVPTTVDIEIEYRGSFIEDILLKVYVIPSCKRGSLHLHKFYDQFTLHGYIHAMQKPRASVRVVAGSYLGFEIHNDINRDWLWKMEKNDPQRYRNFINRSTLGGYRSREDPMAKQSAQEADYIISFTTGNKDENDQLLRHLSSHAVDGPHGNRPITFCTDRSLGFGGHFDAPRGLYLAKHGFGQPTAPGAWFHEYLKAVDKVQFGMLVLNPSREYYHARACQMECQKVPSDKQYFYLKQEHRIVPWMEHWVHTFDNQPHALLAAEEGDFDALKTLYSSDSSIVWVVDERGRTTLYCAAMKGHAEVVEWLLEASADANCQNSAGWGPLHIAAEKGRDEVVMQLLVANAEVNKKSAMGHTPLHWAASYGHCVVAEYLLGAGADINILDADGFTPLVLATKEGPRGFAQFLRGLIRQAK